MNKMSLNLSLDLEGHQGIDQLVKRYLCFFGSKIEQNTSILVHRAELDRKSVPQDRSWQVGLLERTGMAILS
jgi:hypothetical protein